MLGVVAQCRPWVPAVLGAGGAGGIDVFGSAVSLIMLTYTMIVNTSKINIEEIDGGMMRPMVHSEITVDQLAQEAEIPVSTVRLYQNKGLLPPPERRGRVGYYNGGHRDRLRLIATLQERGFSLAAIKDALDSWSAGRSLDHLLGVSDVAPSLVREPVTLSAAEFAAHFEGIDLAQEDVQRAVAMGLVSLQGTDFVVSNKAFIEIGPAVARLGIPMADILDEYEALSESVTKIADRFRGVFERHLWEPFVERGMPAAEVAALTAEVGQLTELATSVVTTELQERFATFAKSYLEGAGVGDPAAP